MRALETKEMPLQEKYDRLFGSYVLGWIRDSVLNKELGAVDKAAALEIEMEKKMLPSMLGPTFKLAKAIAPGRTFKQLAEQFVYTMQSMIPLSNLDLSWVSDREGVITVKNCPMRQKAEELVKKTGVNIDPKELCGMESETGKGLFKEFGVDLAWQHTDNGCKWTARLK